MSSKNQQIEELIQPRSNHHKRKKESTIPNMLKQPPPKRTRPQAHKTYLAPTQHTSPPSLNSAYHHKKKVGGEVEWHPGATRARAFSLPIPRGLILPCRLPLRLFPNLVSNRFLFGKGGEVEGRVDIETQIISLGGPITARLNGIISLRRDSSRAIPTAGVTLGPCIRHLGGTHRCQGEKYPPHHMA